MISARSALKTTAIVICAVFFVMIGYAYRDLLSPIVSPIVKKIGTVIGFAAPCTNPITYSIGTFDEQFGISRSRFLENIAQAAEVWESAIGRDLFEHSDSGKLKMSLLYDYRQKATTDMASLGMTIKDKASAYDALKRRYDSLNWTYGTRKSAFESSLAQYTADRDALQAKVSYWNGQGGAPKSIFDELERERQQINAQAEALNDDKDELNTLGSNVNTTAAALNRLARDLNLNVKSYNTIGASTGEEFDEGEYIRDESGTKINIYQFDSREKLVRVLAHELGHALGMEHVNDPKALMYRLNQNSGTEPTRADLEALKAVCAIR